MVINIVYLGIVLGLIILVTSLINILKIKGKIKHYDDVEFFTQNNMKDRIKFLILGIVGSSIVSILLIIRIIIL